MICHVKTLERSAGRHAVANVCRHTQERFVKSVLNRNAQGVKCKIQIPVVVCALLRSSARTMVFLTMTLVVVRVQTLGMVNNAKSVLRNHVMVMVYGTTSSALACVMRRGSPIRNAKHVALWNVVCMERSLKKTAPVDAKATGKAFNAMSAQQRKSVSSPALTADCMRGTRKSASARNNANRWTANMVGSKIQRAVSVNAIHKVTAPTLAFLATRSCLRRLPFGQVINAKPANNRTRTHVLVRARSI